MSNDIYEDDEPLVNYVRLSDAFRLGVRDLNMNTFHTHPQDDDSMIDTVLYVVELPRNVRESHIKTEKRGDTLQVVIERPPLDEERPGYCDDMIIGIVDRFEKEISLPPASEEDDYRIDIDEQKGTIAVFVTISETSRKVIKAERLARLSGNNAARSAKPN